MERRSRNYLFRPVLRALLMGSAMLGLAAASAARAEPSSDPAAPAVTNTTCPVTEGEEIDPTVWVEYQGKRVYFCCKMCKHKFERDPQAYLAHLPQFAAVAATNAGADDSHDKTNEEEEEEEEYEHGADHTGMAKLIHWLGNFHPASVNFPIALMLCGALAELLVLVTGRPRFEPAARYCVGLGSVSTVAAVVLGWFFAGFRLTDPKWIMTVHRWLGTAAGVWAIGVLILCLAAYRPEPRGRRWKSPYRLALFIGATAIAVNGFFGGALVYGLKHYAW